LQNLVIVVTWCLVICASLVQGILIHSATCESEISRSVKNTTEKYPLGFYMNMKTIPFEVCILSVPLCLSLWLVIVVIIL